MRFWIYILLLVFWIPLSWSVEIDDVDSATVFIVLFNENEDVIGSGSGFFVTDDGHILTNAHVVEGSDINRIRILGKSMPPKGVDARKVWVISDHDVAVLKATKPSGIRPLNLLSENPSKGENVWALGYPSKQIQNMMAFGESFESFDATLTSGIVSRTFEGSTSDSDAKSVIIQHTAEISPGNSGGPLFDECGTVIGMNTFTTAAADEVDDTDFFAIASSGLLKLLNSRIVGLTSGAKCDLMNAQQPVSEPEVLDSEPKIEPESQKDKLMTQEPAKVKSYFSENESIVWLLLILALLGLWYSYFRKAAPVLSLPLTEKEATIIRPKSQLAAKSFRMSGFDERGSPVSFVFQSGSACNLRGCVIGRALDFADFEIINTDISRAHAQVKVTETNCYIRDLGSTNGTSVNAVKLAPFEYTQISYGDEVGIATCKLTITT